MNGRSEVPAKTGAPVRRATIKDVADTAGVSRSTASRALTGNGYVAAKIRKKVLKAAAELNYVPDIMARSLKQQVSRTLGVVVSDLRNPFYADLAAGAGRAARRAGYTMFLVDDGGDADTETEAAQRFVELRVGGVIITPVSAGSLEYLRQHQMPAVEVDRQFAPGEYDAVVVDNRAGAKAVSAHLIAVGHRRIALLIDETDWTTGQDRFEGYRAALAEAGLEPDPELVVATGWDVEAAHLAAKQLLSGPLPPTAVFAANNVLAEGAYRAASELEMRIPEDLSLVSFDDAPWMSMVRPGITAVAQDALALGEAAVERLLDRLASPESPARTVVLPAAVLRRGSTSVPRQD